jgi:cell division protease FtsH
MDLNKKEFLKSLLAFVFLFVIVILLARYMNMGNHSHPENIDYTTFYNDVTSGLVLEVTIADSDIEGKFKTGKEFRTSVPSDDKDLYPLLRDQKVKVTYKNAARSANIIQLVTWAVIILGGTFIFIYFLRQMQNNQGKALSFGRAKPRMIDQNTKKITFADVAGMDEVKVEVQEIIDFLRDPKKFTRLGGRIPKGVIIVGPPGCGKTLLAKAIAGEAGVPFFSISGSEFVEMFVGVGAARVRDLFYQARRSAPCIIFIDEIDAVGRHRGAGLGGGHDEREQTLNQLLVEMDGVEGKEGIITFAATNRPDILDPALLRRGRFDRHIVVPMPDIRGRAEILKVHTRNIPMGEDLDVEVIARGTPGFSGADLANLVNEACLLAARKNQKKVFMADFEEAKDKVLMGLARRSVIMNEDERRTIAYHEAGHALVARLLPEADPVHKVSIIPRGLALGITQQLPKEDRYLMSRTQAETNITVLVAGRASEEIIFKELSSGAGSDLERGTDLARKMVCDWGMSEKLGPLTFGKKEEEVFLGRELGTHKNYSEETAIQIDQEISRIVSESYVRAKELLAANIDALNKIAAGLLERETLEKEDIDRIIRGEALAPVPAQPEVSGPSRGDSKEAPQTTPGVIKPEPVGGA